MTAMEWLMLGIGVVCWLIGMVAAWAIVRGGYELDDEQSDEIRRWLDKGRG